MIDLRINVVITTEVTTSTRHKQEDSTLTVARRSTKV